MREIKVAKVSQMTDDQVRCEFVTQGRHNWEFGVSARGMACIDFPQGYISRTDKCLTCNLMRTVNNDS